MMRRFAGHPALALGSTLVWGAIEILALFRSRRRSERMILQPKVPITAGAADHDVSSPRSVATASVPPRGFPAS